MTARESTSPSARAGMVAEMEREMSEFHPIQIGDLGRNPTLPSAVTLKAYEVYCELHGEQPAMVDLAGRGCRGGFGAGELIAFLYARAFPKSEWSQRVHEALQRVP